MDWKDVHWNPLLSKRSGKSLCSGSFVVLVFISIHLKASSGWFLFFCGDCIGTRFMWYTSLFPDQNTQLRTPLCCCNVLVSRPSGWSSAQKGKTCVKGKSKSRFSSTSISLRMSSALDARFFKLSYILSEPRQFAQTLHVAHWDFAQLFGENHLIWMPISLTRRAPLSQSDTQMTNCRLDSASRATTLLWCGSEFGTFPLYTCNSPQLSLQQTPLEFWTLRIQHLPTVVPCSRHFTWILSRSGHHRFFWIGQSDDLSSWRTCQQLHWKWCV